MQQLGDAEVQQLDLAIVGYQHVGGFQVAVRHQPPVGMRHGSCYLGKQRQALGQAQPALAAPGGDGLAVHRLQRQIGLAVAGQAGVIEAGDMGVGQAGQDVAFAGKALRHRAGQQVGMGQLEGHLAHIGAVVAPRQPDHAHAAAAQLAQQGVGADALAGLVSRASAWRGQLRCLQEVA